ncbi:hypothetical protein QQS21_002338 [Conoideocrella luteorostrata]|uniref:Putative transcription factor kapC n=1 Tax=Conoideocrella luteorostrata TaxID=1105319 RepID=A0AAJ0G2Z6_9HYPO|nr:hypothetical protein QQS21_002338 [Conoideocrella luteorostrata]
MDQPRVQFSSRLRGGQPGQDTFLPPKFSPSKSLNLYYVENLEQMNSANIFSHFSQLSDFELPFSDYSDISHACSSPKSTNGSDYCIVSQVQAEQTSAACETKPAPRRRENRYRNAPPSVLNVRQLYALGNLVSFKFNANEFGLRPQRRRAQNRASQRAYRERKEQRIRDLEQLLQESEQREADLIHSFFFLREKYEQLCVERMEKFHNEVPVSIGNVALMSEQMDPALWSHLPDMSNSGQVEQLVGYFASS